MSAHGPRVEIEYCRRCRWMLRAAWLAQELLSSFEEELGEVALVPGDGGVFEVRVDGESVFARSQAGRFPEAREIKQAVRDRVAPGRPLGHSDAPIDASTAGENTAKAAADREPGDPEPA